MPTRGRTPPYACATESGGSWELVRAMPTDLEGYAVIEKANAPFNAKTLGADFEANVGQVPVLHKVKRNVAVVEISFLERRYCDVARLLYGKITKVKMGRI